MPAKLSPRPFPSWDDYRYFLATSEAGSFTKAASHLGVAQSTLSRRIEHLEQQLGVRLFIRLQSGVTLTADGMSILASAREIGAKIREIQESLVGSDKRLEGIVRISVTDGLATFWLVPRLADFYEKNPGIAIEIQCSIAPADPRTLETDLSIRYQRPLAADLIITKLGALHFVLWASPDYIARHGEPNSVADVLHHPLLDHQSYEFDAAAGEWNDWFALARAANLVCFKTNSSAAMVSAIQSGAGIGMLPTYACACVKGIVPLSLDLKTYSEIWLVYHPCLRETPRVRIVIDWLKDLFDRDAHPWFGDDFRPPIMPEEEKP